MSRVGQNHVNYIYTMYKGYLCRDLDKYKVIYSACTVIFAGIKRIMRPCIYMAYTYSACTAFLAGVFTKMQS